MFVCVFRIFGEGLAVGCGSDHRGLMKYQPIGSHYISLGAQLS